MLDRILARSHDRPHVILYGFSSLICSQSFTCGIRFSDANERRTQRPLRPKHSFTVTLSTFCNNYSSICENRAPGLSVTFDNRSWFRLSWRISNPQCRSLSCANDPTSGLGPMESLPFAVVAASSFVGNSSPSSPSSCIWTCLLISIDHGGRWKGSNATRMRADTKENSHKGHPMENGVSCVEKFGDMTFRAALY